MVASIHSKIKFFFLHFNFVIFGLVDIQSEVSAVKAKAKLSVFINRLYFTKATMILNIYMFLFDYHFLSKKNRERAVIFSPPY